MQRSFGCFLAGEAGLVAFPQRQGFMAATSWKRAGSVARALARLISTSLSRWAGAARRALRLESGSSSRKSTPRCASETSPGLACSPPPTSAAIEAEWCGARKGRRSVSWPAVGDQPATECTIETSSSSRGASGGRIEGRTARQHRLARPGGPLNSSACAPAAAISSTRFALSWPLMSRRSADWPAAFATAGWGRASLACPACGWRAGSGCAGEHLHVRRRPRPLRPAGRRADQAMLLCVGRHRRRQHARHRADRASSASSPSTVKPSSASGGSRPSPP